MLITAKILQIIEVSVEINKQVVLRVLKGAFVERGVTVVERYFSPDYVQHNPTIPRVIC